MGAASCFPIRQLPVQPLPLFRSISCRCATPPPPPTHCICLAGLGRPSPCACLLPPSSHAIVSSSVGPEYYVCILSVVDKTQLEPGCSVLLHNKARVYMMTGPRPPLLPACLPDARARYVMVKGSQFGSARSACQCEPCNLPGPGSMTVSTTAMPVWRACVLLLCTGSGWLSPCPCPCSCPCPCPCPCPCLYRSCRW